MRPTESNIGSPEEQDDASDDVGGGNESREVDENEERSRFETPKTKGAKRKHCKNNSDLDDTALINALQNSEKDEDTNFALSIVPSLKALSPDEKLDAKIQILGVFKN
ncbi:unnamed protein product [Acanthoscelides obtectus]|uniref:BESS domain-containing protein n=1 Tax=Acanthoscelides obtectus TaxID=200917 RepID=A0A9P0M132_ACAOB|nr:unnamed protein product [Acanthoscelides obtectus]CAK1655674.1 hypothetical protein AOBTE_LOCUS19251 [Acanthoscelides obtectus]